MTAILALVSVAIAILGMVSTALALKRERAAVKELYRFRSEFNREVVRAWAERMPRAGKIVADPYAPKDTIYVLNPDMLRGPRGAA